MICSVIATLLFAGQLSASQPAYDLKIKLSIDGAVISTPHLVTKPGETATITQKNGEGESFLEVTASDRELDGQRGILMKFVVGHVSKDGRRKVLSTPVIVAMEKEPAQIAVGNQDGKDVISLSVTATRTQL